MKGSNSEDSVLSPELENARVINLTSPKEKLPSYPFQVSRVSTNHPRKNRFRLQYRIKGKSWILDTHWPTTKMDNKRHSPKPVVSPKNLENSYLYKSIRILSRSAKIMRALSSNSTPFRHKHVGIRKLLNYDLTPSPKENSSFENSSSSINADTPSSVPSISNSSLTDSSDSNVPTVESIDENQNQTPQNRKYIKISQNNRTDIRGKKYVRPRTSYLMSLLEKEQKERIDKDANHEISLHPFCSLNRFNNGSSRIVTASTPRNLSQEFNQEIHDRPHTPENVINMIPESISAIKKSHKKEKLYCHEEQSSTQQVDVSVKNDDLHPGTSSESSEIDMIIESSTASESDTQKKNKNTKRTLIYNLDDECSDIRSDFNRSLQQKTTSMGNDSLESGLDQLESDEVQSIDSNNCENREENVQASIPLIDDNDEEEDSNSKENVSNEEINQPSLQSPSIVNATNKNRMSSPESNLIISQDANNVVTPENHINMLKHVLTESIKKSHKKIKHGNRKKLFTNRQDIELTKSEMSMKDVNDQDIKSQTADMIRISSPENFEFDRPSTPENINSSRLLLLDFNSVKKSHRKDKRSKRTSSFISDYCNRNNESLQSNVCEEKNFGEISCRNESLLSKESPSTSPKKKKKPRSMSLQSSTPKISNASVSLGCKDIDDEFKIYTPIKKQPILLTVTDYIFADEMSQERDKQTTSSEVDYSRCTTPIARFMEVRGNENLTSERDNDTGFETDLSILKTEDTTNLKDKNGRSTPINMSTMELLNNKDSIKKSHKKNKHSRSKRSTLKKKRPYIQESGHVDFTNSENMSEEHAVLSLKQHINNHCAEMGCSIMHEKEDNNYKETDYNDPRPSTSREADNIENARNTVSKFLNTTPPNSLNAINFIKLLHKTSIKKSHKKERDINAQTKYIFMSPEHELSDDGSIFDEEDRLSFMNIDDNNTEITTI